MILFESDQWIRKSNTYGIEIGICQGHWWKSMLLPYLVFTVIALHSVILSGIGSEDRTDAGQTDTKPNIVLIFTDDQGYHDLGSFGSTLIRTPNLDRMAREGVKFTDFYSANSVCSPSRAALLTGSYPPRTGITQVLFPRDTIGLNPDEMTIADMLKAEGYSTACIGKWHLGHHPDFLPTRNGFDSYFGIPYSNDMTIDPRSAQFAHNVKFREGFSEQRVRKEKPAKNLVPLMRDELVIEYPADQTTLTRRYTDEAIEFITENRSNPFFLYLPHTMPHIPLFATPQFLGKSAEGLYGDTIEEIDWSVGRILQTLTSLNIDKKTLVIYTSDNGPWNLKNGHGGSAFPLRGFKFSTYEGGMRVPCLMRWPETIPAGQTCREIAGTVDILPTLAAITGAELPHDITIDGHNILPLMTDPESGISPHSEGYFYYRGNRLEAVRRGNWKLRITGNNNKQSIELYNLANDIGESRNIAETNHSIVDKLKNVMDDFDTSLKSTRRAPGRLRGE